MDTLSQEQVELLVGLRERISDLGLSKDDLEDKNLARFLRARNGDLKQAEIMIRNNYDWKVKEDMKFLMSEYEYPKAWDEAFRYDVVGFDRTGCPIYLVRVGTWDIQKELAYGNKEEFLKFGYHSMEKIMNFLKYLSKDEKHMKQGVGIADLKGFSLRQVTSIDVLDAAIRLLKAYEANFPETVKSVVIINAPWCFQILWKLIKPFVSERHQSKLSFLGGDMEKCRETLLELAEPDQFPACYGGTAPESTKYFIDRDGSWMKSENQNETIIKNND